MKKIIFTILSAAFALSAFAQLAVPFTFTEANFKDGSIVVANVNEGIANETAKWSDGGVYFGGTSIIPGGAGWNWEDKYIVIAIDGIPNTISFSNANGTGVTGPEWYASQSTNTTFSSKLWESTKGETPTLNLFQDTKYIKLCFSGNRYGTMKNIQVSKYTPVANAATAVTANSFTANWNAAKGTNITYTLEVSDANGVVKNIENIIGTSYTVEDLNPLTAYSYVVYVVANGNTTSDASNVIEVTTLPTPTTALDATDVTFNSFTANWEASDIEGATYKVDVMDDDDELVVSASGIIENSYTITDLDPESTYKYSVYVVVGDAVSEASNTIEVTTLPLTPTVALDATDVTFNSFTANWKASDLEGAKYNVDVYDAEGTNIASASNIEENYFEVSNIDPESTYTYVVYVVVGEATSEASNSIEVATLAKPTIILNSEELFISTDTDIEQSETIVVSTVNVEEVTATIAGDAGFYFEGGELTKTVTVSEDGSAEFNLLYKFTEEGDFSGTITFSATDAEDATLSLYATASKPTDVPVNTTTGIVKSFNNGLLLLNGNYANIIVSNLAGKTVAEAKGNSVNLTAGYIYLVKTVDFEGNVKSFRVQ